MISTLLLAGVVKVFLIAGQSNAGGSGIRIQLNPVPNWAKMPANGWTVAPTVSGDTGARNTSTRRSPTSP